MAHAIIKWFQVTVLAGGMMFAAAGWSDDVDVDQQTERPGFGAVLADAVLVRPVTLAATGLGAVVWVVTAPVTILTGTIGEAGQTLVIDPALTTFYRCLGCTEVGWRKLPKKDADDEDIK